MADWILCSDMRRLEQENTVETITLIIVNTRVNQLLTDKMFLVIEDHSNDTER